MSEDMARLLIDHGADVQALEEVTYHIVSPFYHILHQYLINPALEEIDEQDRVQVARVLLDEGADVNASKFVRNHTLTIDE